MRKFILKLPAIIILCLSLVSCSQRKDTPASIAQKWCDLNGKVHKAVESAEKEAAGASLNQFENEMEARYKDDETFMKEIEKEVNKCEDASEGRSN
jgi:hypothetical protein